MRPDFNDSTEHPVTAASGEILPRRPPSIRVPREDGAVLARPPLGEAVELARANRAAVEEGVEDSRRRTIGEILEAAAEETTQLTGETIARPEAEFVVGAGHQPGPFHPGVWIKNFAIDGLARSLGGVGLNVIVDNDVRASSVVRVPAGTRGSPGTNAIRFDGEQSIGPWEETALVDRDCWRSFPSRLTDRLAAWGVSPVADSVWCAPESGRLATELSRTRVRTERAWGLRNLEVSLSRVCETDGFRRFAVERLCEAGRLRDVHNEVLVEYRRLYRLRSETHPVPALRTREGWIETPFWTWRTGERRRRALYVRPDGEQVRLAADEREFATLPADREAAVLVLGELASAGIKLRTRALTTTMFLRLHACDLFVHGVGGAKYDEITDRITARFLGVEPPGFLMLSATRHLPLGGPHEVTVDDERTLRRRLRDLRYNADRHLDIRADPEVARLVVEKRALIAEQHEADAATARRSAERSADNRRRFERLREVNDRLATFAAGSRDAVRENLAKVRERLEANETLTSREWAWWLYPEERLQPWLRDASTP